MIHVSDWNEIDQVISDSALAPEHQQMLKNIGIEYLLA
jgi:DeoR/GlpR family transcriptional regulator of sugar metabolism